MNKDSLEAELYKLLIEYFDDLENDTNADLFTFMRWLKDKNNRGR